MRTSFVATCACAAGLAFCSLANAQNEGRPGWPAANRGNNQPDSFPKPTKNTARKYVPASSSSSSTLTGVTASAQGDAPPGSTFAEKLYFTTDVGLNFMPDIKLDDLTASGFLTDAFGVTTFNSIRATDLKYETELGVRWNIGIGYEFTENFRIQLESGYLHNDVKDIRGTAIINAPHFNIIDTVSGTVTEIDGVSYSGSISQVPIMVAGIYDFDLGENDRTDKSAMAGWRFSPYIGGGVGTVYIDSDSKINANGTDIDLGGTDWVFGYQALAGIEYELANNVFLNISYRFLGLTSADFGLPSVDGDRVDSDIGDLDIKTKAAYNHSLQFGLRIEF